MKQEAPQPRRSRTGIPRHSWQGARQPRLCWHLSLVSEHASYPNGGPGLAFGTFCGVPFPVFGRCLVRRWSD